jgi:PTH2 family peptidyl-tRNA hydrolase
MLPTFLSVLRPLSEVCKADRLVLYKNGTLVVTDPKYPGSIDSKFARFKELSDQRMTRIDLPLFKDYKTCLFTYENFSAVGLLYTYQSTQPPPNQDMPIKAMVNFINDEKHKEIIFDSDHTKVDHYEPAMYLFVNQDLKMGKGKIAGQVGHAVGNIVENLVKKPTQEFVDWSQHLYKKVVLKATFKDLLELAKIPGAHSVVDAGRTQIPENSLTVLGFPPMYKHAVPERFKDFKLL